jgi:hypothetical protein
VIGISIVTSAPAIAALLATGTAFVLIAIREFTAPSPGDPLLRALARLAPFLGGVVLAWCAGAVVHAAAVRAAILGRAGMVDALAAAFPLLRRAGAGAAIQAVAGVILRVRTSSSRRRCSACCGPRSASGSAAGSMRHSSRCW